jgi:hypothetical protein
VPAIEAVFVLWHSTRRAACTAMRIAVSHSSAARLVESKMTSSSPFRL